MITTCRWPIFLPCAISSGVPAKDRRFQDLFKKLVGKIAKPVLRKAFVASKKHLVKNISRIKIGDPKKRQFCQRADALLCRLP